LQKAERGSSQREYGERGAVVESFPTHGHCVSLRWPDPMTPPAAAGWLREEFS
jgi:hypothetical protein